MRPEVSEMSLFSVLLSLRLSVLLRLCRLSSFSVRITVSHFERAASGAPNTKTPPAVYSASITTHMLQLV